MDMNASGPNYFMLQLALLMAPFAFVDRARAACAPGSPIGTSSARVVTEMPHLLQ
jgi:hypothetical protein